MNNHRKTFNQILTLVFIDTGVDNYQQLFDGVVLEAQPFLIDTATDGIQQIGQILQQYPGPKTVEIISHGAPGCLYLGNTQLSLDTLKQYAPEVQLWDIDNLVLYGCHVAAGDAGEEFVGKLSGLMGANISASQTLTGSATKGGNWELEVNTGQQPPTSALQKEVMEAYGGVLNFLELKNEKIIITNADDAFLSDVAATDVDGDGDVDVLIASDLYDYTNNYSYNEIALYLNDGSNNFTEQTISTNADGVNSIFAADVDGDGNVDVLSASYFNDKIALYLNDGSNNFTEQTISTNADSVNSIFAADVDDDGDVDVLSTSNLYDDTSYSNDGKISLYLNDGSNNFTEQTISTNDGFVGSSSGFNNQVFAVDVDGDRDGDVISHYNQYDDISNVSYDTIALYLNDGSNNFTEQTIYSSANGVSSVFAVDVDRDGTVDVLSADYDRKIALYLNDGSNNFIEQTISTNADGVNSIFATDLDSDGDVDVLSTSYYNQIALYLNDGSNNFTEQTISTSADFLRSVFAADLDSDGDVDILSDSWDKIFLYETVLVPNSTPTDLDLDNNIVYENIPPNSVVGKLLTTDPNSADSFTYRLVTGAGDNDNTAFTIDGNQLKINNSPDYETKSSYSIRVKTTDVGGESYQEQLTINVNETPTISINAKGTPTEAGATPGTFTIDRDQETAGNLTVFFTISGTAQQNIDYDIQGIHTIDGTVATVTFNGERGTVVIPDGQTSVDIEIVPRDDVVTDGGETITLTLTEKPQYYVSPTLGDETLTIRDNTNPSFKVVGANEIIISTNADFLSSVFAVDVDGDGDVDVLSASASYYDEKIALYLNDGSNNFTEKTISTNADGVFSVSAADVDGDGDVDVLSASPSSYYDEKISLYLNDGSNNFTEQTIASTTDGYGVASLSAADMDGDGDVDIVGTFGDQISLYLNDGNNNFTEQTISSSANGVYSVSAADVDGDGDVDILGISDLYDDTIDSYYNQVALYLNDGSNNFTEQTISTNAEGVFSVSAADMDGDGDVDILSASNLYDETSYSSYSKIALYLNDGSNNFTEQTISTNAEGVFPVSAVDVDGDGDVDILSASNLYDETSYSSYSKIALYLNDGSNNFTEQTISTNADGVFSVSAADVDGDGDVDVLSASDFYDDTSDSYYSKIALYETVSVLNNSAPTDLDIDNNTVEENVAPNSVVSTLSTTDPNSTDRFTYTLVTGPGDTDNKAFTIDGNQLKINDSPDYDTNSSYSIRVETTDVSGESYQEQLTINVNEAPTVIRGTRDNDRLIGNSDKDRLIGGKGNDFLLGKGGNDILEGRIGFDHLLAGSGDDTLYGGQGRDRLNGGPGDDIITGGASIDRFIFNTNRPYSQDDLGRDTIKDFDVERDIILLDRKTFTAIQEEDSFDDVFDTVTSDAATATKDAVIVYNTNNGNLFYNENGSSAGLGSGGLFVTLENPPTLDADNFYFRG